MLFPDSISTKDLSKLLTIKTAPHLSLEQKERALDQWIKMFWARKTKKQKRNKHHKQKIYWWM